MKVKIIQAMFNDDLEKKINMFLVEISDKQVIDIKYQNGYSTIPSALIIYS